jgi:hypothetical protein
MSRAFVREQDIAAIEELPDRPISKHPNDVTSEGASQIDAELAAVRTAYEARRQLASGARYRRRKNPSNENGPAPPKIRR